MKDRPAQDEYAPYAAQYVSLVTGTDVLVALQIQLNQMTTLFAGRGERDGTFRYALGKWTIKEVVGHVTDSERIFSHRALCIARGDKTPLAGFEQDDYARGARSNRRKLADLVQEFADVRISSLSLFSSFDEEAWLCRGVANNSEVTVRGLAYIVAGHELHHRRILDERYFPAIPRA